MRGEESVEALDASFGRSVYTHLAHGWSWSSGSERVVKPVAPRPGRRRNQPERARSQRWARCCFCPHSCVVFFSPIRRERGRRERNVGVLARLLVFHPELS